MKIFQHQLPLLNKNNIKNDPKIKPAFLSAARRTYLDISRNYQTPGPGNYQISKPIIKPIIETLVKKQNTYIIKLNDMGSSAFKSEQIRFKYPQKEYDKNPKEYKQTKKKNDKNDKKNRKVHNTIKISKEKHKQKIYQQKINLSLDLSLGSPLQLQHKLQQLQPNQIKNKKNHNSSLNNHNDVQFIRIHHNISTLSGKQILMPLRSNKTFKQHKHPKTNHQTLIQQDICIIQSKKNDKKRQKIFQIKRRYNSFCKQIQQRNYPQKQDNIFRNLLAFQHTKKYNPKQEMQTLIKKIKTESQQKEYLHLELFNKNKFSIQLNEFKRNKKFKIFDSNDLI